MSSEPEGRFSIAARLLLTETQRNRLLALCQHEARDLHDTLTTIVGTYLDQRDDLPLVDLAPPATEHDRDLLRRNLRQLRAQAGRLGDRAPDWLRTYIAELEHELRSQP